MPSPFNLSSARQIGRTDFFKSVYMYLVRNGMLLAIMNFDLLCSISETDDEVGPVKLILSKL